MRLAALIPSLPAEIVTTLDGCGIRTDSDLLFQPLTDVYRRLPSGLDISLLDLERAVALTAALASAPGVSGVDFLAQETQAQERAPVLSSGVKGLDDLMGGLGGRRVIEISGDRQSGKTTMVLNTVLRHLSEYSDGHVVWIDTTGDFSVEQTASIIKTYDFEGASTALDRLQVSLAFDIEAAYNVLDELQHASSDTRLSCVVFDAITPLLGPLLSAVSAQGHSIMTEFMRQLRIFSQSHSCPIIVINTTSLLIPKSNSASAPRKPALGPSFKFMTDATLWLSKPADEDATLDRDRGYTVRSAEVLRSKSTVSITSRLDQIAGVIVLVPIQGVKVPLAVQDFTGNYL
ncbi:hypothetical protein DXG01_014007 [Tephrocybe rancida]|nr:hypothetical protein DXG01_014007 [Tephrocybe rancida]